MIDILLNLDLTKNPVTNLPELDPSKCKVIRSGVCIGRMPKGTAQGNSTVMIIAKLPNGEHVVIETSLMLFAAAADTFRAADKDDAKKSAEAKN